MVVVLYLFFFIDWCTALHNSILAPRYFCLMVSQITKASREPLKQGEADRKNPRKSELTSSGLGPDDASWLPQSRGYNEEETTTEGESEQDVKDRTTTTWPQVGE